MPRVSLALVFVVLPMTLLAAPVPKQRYKEPPDLQRFVGAWDVYTNEAAVGQGSNTIWTFTETTMYSDSGNTNWTLKLDPEQSPKHFSITQVGGGNSVYLGIYAFEDDKLRIIYSTQQGFRPTTLTPGEASCVTNVLMRSKKQPEK